MLSESFNYNHTYFIILQRQTFFKRIFHFPVKNYIFFFFIGKNEIIAVKKVKLLYLDSLKNVVQYSYKRFEIGG